MRLLIALIALVSSTALAGDQLDKIKPLLVETFGGEVRPYSTQDFGRSKYQGAVSIIIPEQGYASSLAKIRKRLPSGYLAFIGTTRNLSSQNGPGVELVVLQSDDKFDILRASKSDGINYNITNEKLIEKLKSWDAKYNIDIWQAESDTVQLTLARLPRNVPEFAKEVYAFCPDIIDQGSGNISDISGYLLAENALYLWWD